MGIKGLMTAMGMNGFALASLLLCFSSFVAITIWTWTRPRHEIEGWARLYEDGKSSIRPDSGDYAAMEPGDGRSSHAE